MQAVEIKVLQGERALIIIHDRECRAPDDAGNPHTGSESLHEMGLTGA